MAWMDPFDQISYHALVGRVVQQIVTATDHGSVFSCGISSGPPVWGMEPWYKALGRRRSRGVELLSAYSYLGTIDICNFYPTVQIEELSTVLTELNCQTQNVEDVAGWLHDLDQISGVKGLPVGPQSSQILANGLLIPLDLGLSEQAVPFIRWVDDTWLFVNTGEQYRAIKDWYESGLRHIGLRLNEEKSRILEGADAENEIVRSAIQYFGEQLDDPGPDGLRAAIALWEYATEDPIVRRSELRRALRSLTAHGSRIPFDRLIADPSLLRLATEQWVEHLSSLVRRRETRAEAESWALQIACEVPAADDGYKNLLALQSLSAVSVSREEGGRLLDLATMSGGWAAPVRVWAAYVWGKSQAFKAERAIDQVEEQGDFTTKRAFALTLEQQSGHRKMERWCRRIELSDAELGPAARLLDAA